MKAIFLTTALVVSASAQTVNFDGDKTGEAPDDWTCTKTGSGSPKWTVVADGFAPSKSNVLKQSGEATYPVALKDGFVEVKFKPVSGKEDQAGGVDFAGNKFTVTFDGRKIIEASDDSFSETGKVGVWTKADSVTLFDDFSYGGK